MSKVPLIATDASTSNSIVLDTGVISKTGTPEGACAWLREASTAHATTQRTNDRTEGLLNMPTKLWPGEIVTGGNTWAWPGSIPPNYDSP